MLQFQCQRILLPKLTKMRCECPKLYSSDGCFKIEHMNKQIIAMEYAILGPIVIKARQLEEELKKGARHPFSQIIYANIGDAQNLGQKPITFVRQVAAAVAWPALLEHPEIPEDVKQKAKSILKAIEGRSIGSYSDPKGIQQIREHISDFITRRDNCPSNVEDIHLCAGATEGVLAMLRMLSAKVRGKRAGIMVPIPMYPLYSAAVVQYGMLHIGYYLDESNNWELSMEDLERAINEARSKCHPRAIAVINPSNPTGAVLSETNIEDLVKFAYKEQLLLMADEVYQENIYGGKPFVSVKKVVSKLGEPYSKLEVASFNTASKGSTGECGLRGGYAEVCNLCPSVRRMYNKSLSVFQCPNLMGQTVMDCIVDPPKPMDPSYPLHVKERLGILDSLKLRGKMLYEAFAAAEGFKCCPITAAMYAYPSISLPAKAIQAAQAAGQAPDVFYVLKLLNETGICVIPGTGFGQKPGTYHFRTTILPQIAVLKVMVEKFTHFHKKFVEQYS